MRQMKLTLLRSSQDAAVSETNSQLTIDNMQSLIYSPWSEWSSCSRKCKQERSRQCTAPWRCGNVVTKEERSCTGRRCKRQPFTIVDDDPRCRKGLSYGDVKFDPDILQDMTDFSTWSEWSPCTKRCRTRRYSTCKMETSCGSSVIQEDAYCYVKGTICERMYRRRKKVQVAPNGMKITETFIKIWLICNSFICY